MISLFVYGTLRPGHRLYRLIEPVVVDSAPGYVKGKLYHVTSGSDAAPVYPVADFYDDEDSIIYGDVLWVDPGSEEFEYVNHMECSSGYRPVRVKVWTELRGRQHYAEAFGYQYEDMFGAPIESGDWETCVTL